MTSKPLILEQLRALRWPSGRTSFAPIGTPRGRLGPMARSLWVCTMLGLTVASCGTAASPPAPAPVLKAPPIAVEPELITSADELCSMLFEAPRRRLGDACSGKEQQSQPYEELKTLVTSRVAACKAALEPALTAGRVRVTSERAHGCVAEIEAAPWHAALRDPQLARFSSCAALVVGVQNEGDPCRLNLECSEGNVCGGASEKADGHCQKRLAKTCAAPALWLLGEHEAQCGDEAYCEFTHDSRPEYAREGTAAERLRLALLDAAEFGMIGKLDATGAPSEATGNMWGDSIGESFGAGGLGLSGIGEGGTGEGIGLGSIGAPKSSAHKAAPPRARLGATSTSGRLPAEVIQRIVRQSFGRFRACYQAGLKDQPDLKGKITVRFEITKAGTVAKVSSQSDLPDPKVVACVEQSFAGLSFPQPDGGIVTVSYPIVFSPGGDESAPAKRPAEPAPLTCEARALADEACERGERCASGICRAYRCASALGAKGDPCARDGECAHGLYCGPEERGRTGTCEPLRAAGAACRWSSQCEGACVDEVCVALCDAGH